MDHGGGQREDQRRGLSARQRLEDLQQLEGIQQGQQLDEGRATLDHGEGGGGSWLTIGGNEAGRLMDHGGGRAALGIRGPWGIFATLTGGGGGSETSSVAALRSFYLDYFLAPRVSKSAS